MSDTPQPTRDPVLVERTLAFLQGQLRAHKHIRHGHHRRALDLIALEFDEDAIIENLRARIDRELDAHPDLFQPPT